MAARSTCSINKGGGLRCSNGCNHILFVFSVMLCILFMPSDGNKNPLLYDRCEGFKNFDGSFETKWILEDNFELKNVCFQSNSLCFPSTLIDLGTNNYGLNSEKKNLDVDSVCSCIQPRSLNIHPVTVSSESSTSPFVSLSPPLLDWGTNSLFTASLVYLTVGNMHNSSVLHVFETFSSSEQFYIHGFENFSLNPGEASSISFVFFPKMVGLASAHIVLETSFGGFVINAKGTGIESPYKIEPSRSFEQLLDGKLTWNLSLYNSLDEVLYVQQVDTMISSFSENSNHEGNLVCSIFGLFGSFCKIGERKIPWMEIRPHKNQEVPPLSSEIIMKLILWPPITGKFSGDICIKLRNVKQDRFETIRVPLEFEVDNQATYNSISGSISLFFEPLVHWDDRRFVCTLSIRNSASYLLNLVSITENLNVFKVNYMDGLLLYPETITHVAFISYDLHDHSELIPEKIPRMSPDCTLTLLTNDSITPQIEINCFDVIQSCCGSGVGSCFIEPEYSFIRLKSKEEKVTNARSGSLESIIEESLPFKMKSKELLEADQQILKNWRSQGTMSNLSVLKDPEIVFPVVQIGSILSEYVSVHNPSHKPVIMQLILNSGAIVDQCKFHDDSLLEIQDGFSIPEKTTTNILVHPFESAQIGPIFFRPSKRCAYKSSVLIRNNLSGVEWLSIRAFGGSGSLQLLDGPITSKPVNKIEFNFELSTCKSCANQLFKELYAKNEGELPLKVIKLKVSGTDCGSDGFFIHTCKGFHLLPGESEKIIISYQPDFSSEIIQKKLKMVMDTGFIVIPMEAKYSINLTSRCKRSMFWIVIWKLSALIITTFFICLLFFILLHPIASGNGDYSIKSDNNIATSKVEKPSRVHRTTRNGRPLKKNGKLEESLNVDTYSYFKHEIYDNSQKVKVNNGFDNQEKPTIQSIPPTKLLNEEINISETLESPQNINLTVKIAKERGRRRRKKRVTSKFEVSSSQSGNSTPSSPMSPTVASNPRSSFTSYHEKKQEFTIPEPQKIPKKPVLLPSATFPSSVSTTNILASYSPIAPYARAPGSKLSQENGSKKFEDEAFSKEYIYDIWGNHFCGNLMEEPKKLSLKMRDVSEGDSQSFFSKDPRSLMMISSAQSESSGHKLGLTDVDYNHEIK